MLASGRRTRRRIAAPLALTLLVLGGVVPTLDREMHGPADRLSAEQEAPQGPGSHDHTVCVVFQMNLGLPAGPALPVTSAAAVALPAAGVSERAPSTSFVPFSPRAPPAA